MELQSARKHGSPTLSLVQIYASSSCKNETPTSVEHRIALMQIAQETLACTRANDLVDLVLNPNKRSAVTLKNITVNQQAWFHRRRHGWRIVTVTQINLPAIFVTINDKTYPTLESRVRPLEISRCPLIYSANLD